MILSKKIIRYVFVCSSFVSSFWGVLLISLFFILEKTIFYSLLISLSLSTILLFFAVKKSHALSKNKASVKNVDKNISKKVDKNTPKNASKKVDGNIDNKINKNINTKKIDDFFDPGIIRLFFMAWIFFALKIVFVPFIILIIVLYVISKSYFKKLRFKNVLFNSVIGACIGFLSYCLFLLIA